VSEDRIIDQDMPEAAHESADEVDDEEEREILD
jgi:hypothetical protein